MTQEAIPVEEAQPTHGFCAERFWPKVMLGESGCWLWTASVSTAGYGQFWTGRRIAAAHRIAYEEFVGPIPEGLQLDHLCRNRGCVNPAHLEPVTCRENLMRGDTPAARQLRRTHCPSGHPYAGDNLYVYKGERRCRECGRAACRAWQARRRAVA